MGHDKLMSRSCEVPCMRWINQEKGGRELGHRHPHPPDPVFSSAIYFHEENLKHKMGQMNWKVKSTWDRW